MEDGTKGRLHRILAQSFEFVVPGEEWMRQHYKFLIFFVHYIHASSHE